MNNWMKSLTNIGLPQSFHITYIVEILILTVIIYELLIWVKNTRAWTLLKGIVVVTVFALGSYFFHLTTLTWIMSKTAGVLVTVVVMFFSLSSDVHWNSWEERILSSLFSVRQQCVQRRTGEVWTRSIPKFVRAVYEMGKVKTGALIVMEKQVILNEYERTGIPIDAQISSQLLMNIFEHNTPLHDGAVFIRNQRIVAATCYLPLSDNMDISKALGTRHRAAVGVSEATDSVTLVVSEETGRVSVAVSGRLKSVKDGDELRDILSVLVKRETENTGRFRIWKGRRRNERKADE